MPNPFRAQLAGEVPFQRVPYDPEPGRDKIRASVALAAMFIFALVVGWYLYFSSTATPENWKQMKDAMQAVLPAVTSVLGTVLGFYFGSQKL